MVRKRALLVGINSYPQAVGPLKGCVHDALRMKWLLQEIFYFPDAGIRELYNANATREAILDSLNWLVSDTKMGDVLMWYYSGHGTRIDSSHDPSGKDEVLVTFNPAWDDLFDTSITFRAEDEVSQFIRDKEIKATLSTLGEGVNLTLVMDCCHSGDIHKDISATPRYLEPPASVQVAIEKAQREYWQRVQENMPEPSPDDLKLSKEQWLHLGQKIILGNRFDFADTQENSILLAACSEKETALEKLFEGQVSGVFTYNLINVLSQSGDWTYGELISALGDKMRFTPQMPHLACPKKYRRHKFLSPF